jgi:cytochrome d ubiquinol oxidase subunit I
VTAESGRQPWVVFGYLRTSAAVSQLASGEVLFSTLGFSLLYLVMLVAYIAYILRAVRIGPERDHPDQDGRSRSITLPAPAPAVIGSALANGQVK